MAVTPYEERKYTQSDAVTQAQQTLQNHQSSKPGDYTSQWQSQLNDTLSQIQNRPGFSYDVNADALYQQVAQNYLQQGKTAMMDTMGQAAALTGGYGNSYAQTAGQQQYNQYLQGLAELVPQYQQMALEQYQMEGEDLLNRYNLLMDQEESAYSRYMDMVNQYYADLDRYQDAYDNEREFDYSQFTDDREFDYGKYQDELEYQYQLDRDAIEDEQWLKEYEETVRQFDEELAETIRQFDEELAWEKESYWSDYYSSSSSSSSGGSSSGGSGSGSGSGNDDDDDDTMTLPMAAAEVAKQYSVEDAVDWVNSQTNVSQAEKNAAIDNAKGVAQTEYYKKMLAAMNS